MKGWENNFPIPVPTEIVRAGSHPHLSVLSVSRKYWSPKLEEHSLIRTRDRDHAKSRLTDNALYVYDVRLRA